MNRVRGDTLGARAPIGVGIGGAGKLRWCDPEFPLSARDCRSDIGCGKIVTNEQQGQPARLRQGIAEQITEIELGRVPVAFTALEEGSVGSCDLFVAGRHDLDAQGIDQLSRLPRPIADRRAESRRFGFRSWFRN